MLDEPELIDRTNHWVYEHIRTGYSYIAFNQEIGDKKTVFADKRVRQAMTMIIDRDSLIDEVYQGFAVKATGPFHHLGPQYNHDIEAWPYDPERAVKLLESAGFSRRADGTILDPDGEPFSIQLVYPAGSDLYQKLCLSLKDNFAKAGITLQLEPQKWVLLLKTLNERTFESITLGWGGGGIESDIEQMFHTSSISDDGDNRQSYSNPELDKLIEKAHITLDDDERYAIWKKCHAILHEDQPYTFMTRPKVRLWMDNRIQNVKRIDPLGINFVSTWHTPIEWYVPEGRQKRGAAAEAASKN